MSKSASDEYKPLLRFTPATTTDSIDQAEIVPEYGQATTDDICLICQARLKEYSVAHSHKQAQEGSQCQAWFHPDCIKTWISQPPPGSKTCPQCKQIFGGVIRNSFVRRGSLAVEVEEQSETQEPRERDKVIYVPFEVQVPASLSEIEWYRRQTRKD